MSLLLPACLADPPAVPLTVRCAVEIGGAEAIVGSSVDLTVTVEVLTGSAPPGALLYAGFPHPWFGSRAFDGQPAPRSDAVSSPEIAVDGVPPITLVRAGTGWGRFFDEGALVKELGAGSRFTLSYEALPLPIAAGVAFAPVLALETSDEGPTRTRRTRVCLDLAVQTVPAPPVRLVLVAPAVARPGADVEIGLRLEDRFGNPSGRMPAELALHWQEVRGAASVRSTAEHSGAAPASASASAAPGAATVAGSESLGPGALRSVGRFRLEAPSTPGVYVLTVAGALGLPPALSDPIFVDPSAPTILWGDLHGHGALSDGWKQPTAYFAFAREAAFLDVAALTEHDWQLDPGEFEALRDAAERADDPGAFVTLFGLETNVSGHEVAYFADPPAAAGSVWAQGGATELWSETDLGDDTAVLSPSVPALLDAAAGRALLVTHTSLSGGMGTPLPPARPFQEGGLIEIYSAHGNSECRDCGRSDWPPPRGDDLGASSVRDILQTGAVLGFIAAGDSHDGRPGATAWGAWPGGLTAFVGAERTRDSVFGAMNARHVYATTGTRTFLEVRIGEGGTGEVGMGEVLVLASRGADAVKTLTFTGSLRFRVVDGRAVRRVEVVGRSGVLAAVDDYASPGWRTVPLPALVPGDFVYVKVVLDGGAMAWSSPVYVRSADSAPP